MLQKKKDSDSLQPPKKAASKQSSRRPNHETALRTDDIMIVFNPTADDPMPREINRETGAAKLNINGAHLDADQCSLSSNSSELSQVDSDFQSIGTGATDITSDLSGNSRERRKRSIVDSRF